LLMVACIRGTRTEVCISIWESFHLGVEYSHYAAKIVHQQGYWQSKADETISLIPSPKSMKIKTESPKFS